MSVLVTSVAELTCPALSTDTLYNPEDFAAYDGCVYTVSVVLYPTSFTSWLSLVGVSVLNANRVLRLSRNLDSP